MTTANENSPGKPEGVITSPPATCSALFIGGENDGKRMSVEPLPIIRLPLPREKQTGWQMETEYYRAEILATQHAEFGFYRSTSITLEEAIRLLFKFYTPNESSSATGTGAGQPKPK